MAKKQTRRSVSLNRTNYEAAKLEADRRGVSLAMLVESGLAAIGVPIVAHPQQTSDLAQANAARRAKSIRIKRPPKKAAAKKPSVKPPKLPKPPKQSAAKKPSKLPEPPVPRPSRERQVLGDQAADAYGFA